MLLCYTPSRTHLHTADGVVLGATQCYGGGQLQATNTISASSASASSSNVPTGTTIILADRLDSPGGKALGWGTR